MTDTSIYKKISSVLAASSRFCDLILFRDSDEAEFLKKFVCGERSRAGSAVQPGAVSCNDEKPATVDSLEKVKSAIEGCEICGENTEKKFGVGNGSSGVMVILNAPLLMSDSERNFYRDDSIQLMKKMIESINISFSSCYTTNLVKCRPFNPIIKPSEKVHNCIPMIEKEIDVVKPSIVIVMGDILPLQSIVHDSRGIFWYTVEHPVTILKNPEMKRKAWNTLKTVIQKKQELGL